MSTAPSLRELQLWMRWIVTDPRGVTEALADPSPKVDHQASRYTCPTSSYLSFVSPASTSVTERLDVYAEGYFSRILDCLKADFTRTSKVLGDEAFTKLVAEYLKAHPSRYASIDEVGNRLPDFIFGFDGFSLPPYLESLARFEWLWLESFFSKEVAIDREWTRRLEESTNARIQVHPSVRLLLSRSPLATLIKTLDAAEPLQSEIFERESDSAIVIYRYDDHVEWEELEPELHAILGSLSNGSTLDQAFSEAADIDPVTVSRKFAQWVERGILCGCVTDDKE